MKKKGEKIDKKNSAIMMFLNHILDCFFFFPEQLIDFIKKGGGGGKP